MLCVIADEYDVSLDDFIISKRTCIKATKRTDTKQIERMIEKCDEKQLKIIRDLIEVVIKNK